MARSRALPLALVLALLLAPAGRAQDDAERVQLDFQSTELGDVVAMMAEFLGASFAYDPEQVRGRVTVISPVPVTRDEARRVFESMLQVHGLTLVVSPAGALRIVRIEEALGAALETRPAAAAPRARDVWVTQLLPLDHVRVESLGAVLRPLVSAQASLIAYAPSNTLIVTDSEANVRRLADLIAPLDVPLHGERIRVLPLRHADPGALAAQLDETFAADPSAPSEEFAGRVRFLPDARTRSLIAVAPPRELEQIDKLVGMLDRARPASAGVRVIRLLNARATELAETLASSAELSAQTRIAADVPTNSLVVQAGPEDFAVVSSLVADLDRRRPQVLVQAMILEVDVTDSQDLGIAWLYQNVLGESGFVSVGVDPDAALPEPSGVPPVARGEGLIGSSDDAFRTAVIGKSVTIPGVGTIPISQAVLSASRSDSDANVVSAPMVLTADGEEARIEVGSEIPIPTSRLETSAPGGGFQTSQDIARENVGVTLRVRPRIGEGDRVRLDVFQELSQVRTTDPELGPTTRNRRLESTVYLDAEQAVAIGGIVSDVAARTLRGVPLLGRIPLLGRLFRSDSDEVRKVDVLVVLVPHIVRDPEDLQRLTVEERERFREEARVEAASGVAQRAYLVQAAFFRDADAAAALLAELIALGYDGSVLSRVQDGPPVHFVELGPYASEAAARRVAGELRTTADLRPLVVVAHDP